AFPEILEIGGPENTRELLGGLFLDVWPKELILDKAEPLNHTEMIDLSIIRIHNKDYSKEELSNFYLAAEMLLHANDIGMAYDSDLDMDKAYKLLNFSRAERLLVEVGEHSKGSTDFELNSLCLKAYETLVGLKMNHPDKYRTSEEDEEQFKNKRKGWRLEFISLLENVFLDNTEIKLSSAEIRGKLHEFLWFLDFSMLLFRNGDDGKRYISPARTFEDAPRVGYPENNRGFDYFLGEEGRGVLMVQLKSKETPHHIKTYHPTIEVIGEKNFPDVDRRRLESKFEAYKNYLQKEDEKSWETSRRYILGSVLETWEDFPNKLIKPHQKFHSIYESDQELPKNKSARRRLMKDLKKRGIKINP
ncbi:MAG TPA: hypothetical protein VES68_01685, partial [Candidatus Sulfotelmatobacter sp.]|nr:hypothetical protein [Candidatus Sulfotelmatobacter sp.]